VLATIYGKKKKICGRMLVNREKVRAEEKRGQVFTWKDKKQASGAED